MKDGLHLYSKTFDPNAPDYNMIAGFIEALADFGGVMTGKKKLASVKFVDDDKIFASYLILERKDMLLLAIFARLEKEKANRSEEKITEKMNLFLTEFLEISSSDLLNPVIETSKYSFADSLFYSFFFREYFETLDHSTLKQALQAYGPDRMVIGLNREWKGRYSFYKNDPSFLKVMKGFNAERHEILLDKMDNTNLYISVQDFMHYIGKMESSEKVEPNQQLIEFLAFVMKKGILELFTIHP
jgi:hypothetical protein